MHTEKKRKKSTSAAERITLVPTTDSAYRWISWHVPTTRVRKVTTGALSACLACSAPAPAPAQPTAQPRANTQAASKNRAMAHPLRPPPDALKNKSLPETKKITNKKKNACSLQVDAAAARRRFNNTYSVSQTGWKIKDLKMASAGSSQKLQHASP